MIDFLKWDGDLVMEAEGSRGRKGIRKEIRCVIYVYWLHTRNGTLGTADMYTINKNS